MGKRFHTFLPVVSIAAIIYARIVPLCRFAPAELLFREQEILLLLLRRVKPDTFADISGERMVLIQYRASRVEKGISRIAYAQN